MQGFAYLSLGNSNGGSVVDVSEGGLGFRTVAPVRKNGTIPVRFSERNHRIEADGELAWTDGSEKGGGLKFTVLPSESREQIRRWVSENAIVPGTNGSNGKNGSNGAAVVLPESVIFPVVDPLAAIGPELPPSVVARPFAGAAHEGAPPEVEVKATPLRGFSGGLMTGLLVSAVVVAVVLLTSYRREFGQALIHMGERFAGTTQTQTQAAATLPPESSPVPTPSIGSARQSAVPLAGGAKAQPAAPARDKVAAPAPVAPAPTEQKKAAPEESDVKVIHFPRASNSAMPLAASHNATVATKNPTSLTPGGVSATPPPVSAESLPPATGSSDSGPSADKSPDKSAGKSAGKPGATAPLPSTNGAAVGTETPKQANTRTTAEMFFEVGKFKDEVSASSTKDRLAQLGFPTSELQQGRLWMNSYHVLVGPYSADDEAKAARKKLATRGFAPKAFRRGSRSLTVLSGLTLNGAPMPAGDYTISWESYVTDAAVKIAQGDKVVANADGKWVKRPSALSA